MGFIRKDGQKKEETEAAENQEYQFPEEAELKECRYCRVMIPKTAKMCPNCKKRLKRNWVGFFLSFCALAACGAGAYYYLAVYSPAHMTVSEEAVESAEAAESEGTGEPVEAVKNMESGQTAESAPYAGGIENGQSADAVQEEESGKSGETLQNPEVQVLAGTEDLKTEAEKESEVEKETEAGNKLEAEKETEAGNKLEAEKETEAGNKLEAEKETEAGNKLEAEKETEAGNKLEAEKETEAGNKLEAEKETKTGNVLELGKETIIGNDFVYEKESEAGKEDGDREAAGNLSDADSDIIILETTELSDYTEEAFRALCKRVDYKKLLRSQDTYLNAAVMEELTVMEQVDGGLFDENIYYLCRREDGQGITRYYIIRDDREEDDTPILAGDVIQVYGQLFGSCKLPGYLVKAQPVVPAVTMLYFDLLEE